MFNHQKDRNYATSQEIDNWNIITRGEILKSLELDSVIIHLMVNFTAQDL